MGPGPIFTSALKDSVRALSKHIPVRPASFRLPNAQEWQ